MDLLTSINNNSPVNAKDIIDMYEKCIPKSNLPRITLPVKELPNDKVILASANTIVNVNSTCIGLFIV